jgi:hypothetical protein
MKIRMTAVAGLALSLTAFTVPAFAQGMGGAGGGGSQLMGNAPAAGAPGTQAPASGAPPGAASSDWMSHEGKHAATGQDNSPRATQSETQARRLQVQTGREITAARAQGKDVAQAARQRYLGSVALQKGDREGAIPYYRRAHAELERAGYASAKPNSSREAAHADETSRATGAVNINLDRGKTAASSY